MKAAGLCRVCRIVGDTINADCGHEVHSLCCHEEGARRLGLVVCLFCWHGPVVVLKRAGVAI